MAGNLACTSSVRFPIRQRYPMGIKKPASTQLQLLGGLSRGEAMSMTGLRQRFNDWLLERRIEAIRRHVHDADERGDREAVRAYCCDLLVAINRRSPGQVQRMVRKIEERIRQGW